MLIERLKEAARHAQNLAAPCVAWTELDPVGLRIRARRQVGAKVLQNTRLVLLDEVAAANFNILIHEIDRAVDELLRHE